MSRSAIELPTAEPEFYIITSDDEFDDSRPIIDGSLRTPKIHLRHTSPPETTGLLRVPPELIITGTQSKCVGITIETADEIIFSDKGAKSQLTTGGVSELPPITSTKRNNSWHNFRKCVPILR